MALLKEGDYLTRRRKVAKIFKKDPSPSFIQRFNLDTEHHREGTEKHGEMILSVYLCEKTP